MDTSDIGKSVQFCLNKNGMLKQELAQKMGVSVQTVSILCKSRNTSARNLKLLCDIFEMSLSELIKIGE